jgi:pyruvate dehydrogenase E1 component alpha subunit
VIENNGYGMGTSVGRSSAITDLYERAAAYNMPGVVVDGQDVDQVMAATVTAVERARRESAPTLMEIRTYRYVGHSMSDAAHGTYRSKDEVEEYRKRDPIHLLAERMRAGGYLDDEGYAALDEEAQAEADDAIQFAEDAPEPEPEALFTDVYAESN